MSSGLKILLIFSMFIGALSLSQEMIRSLVGNRENFKCWMLIADDQELENISPLLVELLEEGIQLSRLNDLTLNFIKERKNPDVVEDICNVLVLNNEFFLNYLEIIYQLELLESFQWWVQAEKEFFDELPLRLDSLVYWIKELPSGIFNISEVYKVKKGNLRENWIATWDLENPDVWICNTEFIWNRRSDLTGVEISNAVEHSFPAESLILEEIDGLLTVVDAYGIFPDVYKTLQKVMNFTFTMVLSPDRNFGAQDDNGNWTGMIRMLDNKEVDMSFCGFSIAMARSKVMDFSMPLFQEMVRLTIRKPKASLNWLTYFEVFDKLFWYTVTVFFIIFVVIFLAFVHFGWDDLHEPMESESFGFLNAIGLVGITFLQREYPIQVTRASSKIMLWTMYICAFLVFVSYCATLTSTLTLENFQPPVESLLDVYSKSYRLLVWKGTIYETYFRTATAGIEKKLWSERIKEDEESFISSKEEGLEKVYEDDINVFFGPTLGLKGILHGPMKEQSCEIYQLQEVYLKLKDAMAFQKRSEFTQLFSYQISKLHQLGQIDYIMRKYLPEDYHICPNSASIIGYENTVLVFSMLAVGAGLASLITLLEYFKKKFRN